MLFGVINTPATFYGLDEPSIYPHSYISLWWFSSMIFGIFQD